MPTESPLGRYFRENLRAARVAQGMSLSELSRRLSEAGWGVFHTTTLTRIESGERAVKLDEAAALADFVGRGLADMVTAPAPTEAVYAANEAQAAYTEGWSKVVGWAETTTRAEAVLRARLDELTARIERDEYPDEGQRRFAVDTLDNGRRALRTTIAEAVHQGIRQGTDG